MKKMVVVLVSLIVAVLVGGENVFAQDKTPEAPLPEPSLGPEWELVGENYSGTTVYVNTKRITYLPKGIVKVWALWVTRGETREMIVNALKKDLLSEGEDPNKAEGLWHCVELKKINCKNHQIASLKVVCYSFEGTVLDSASSQYERWNDVVPESIMEEIEKYVCKKHKSKK